MAGTSGGQQLALPCPKCGKQALKAGRAAKGVQRLTCSACGHAFALKDKKSASALGKLELALRPGKKTFQVKI